MAFVGAVLGAIFADKIGRRNMMLISTFCIMVVFIILTPLTAINLQSGPSGFFVTEIVPARICIALVYIYSFVFSVGYTPLQLMYPLEVLSNDSRAKGMAMLNFWVSLAGFYNQFVSGIAMAAILWWYYLVFIFWSLAVFVFVYRYFVETSKRTPEEMTEIFRSRYPVKTSLAKSEIIIHGDNIIIHEVDKIY